MSAQAEIGGEDGSKRTPPPSTSGTEPAKVELPTHFYSPLVGYGFAVNYIVGVGVLSVPYAFFAAGLPVSITSLFLASIIELLAVYWILEASARAKVLGAHDGLSFLEWEKRYKKATEGKDATKPLSPRTQVLIDNAMERAIQDRMEKGDVEECTSSVQPHCCLPDVKERVMGDEKLEVSQMMRFFFGKTAERAYVIALAIYMCFGLWAYAAVAAETLTAILPLPFILPPCDGNCTTFLDPNAQVNPMPKPPVNTSACDRVGIPLLKEEEEKEGGVGTVPLPTPLLDSDLAQLGNSSYPTYDVRCQYIYVFFLACFALVVVPVSCLELTEQKWMQVVLCALRFVAIALMIATAAYSMATGNTEIFGNQYKPNAPFHESEFSSIGLIISTACFSQIVHHSIPGISNPIKNKKVLPSVFTPVYITTFSIYASLGIVMSIFFKAGLQNVATLNWLDYQVVPLRYIIILFPVFDVTSAFPLNALTAANNLFYALPTRHHKKRWKKVMFRLAIAIPPIIGAAFVRSLSTIVDWSGLVGLIIVFIVPALLHLASLRDCEEVFAGRPWTRFLGLSFKETKDVAGRGKVKGKRRGKTGNGEEERSLLTPQNGGGKRDGSSIGSEFVTPTSVGGSGNAGMNGGRSRSNTAGTSASRRRSSSIVQALGPYGGDVGLKDVGRTAYTITWWMSSRGMGYFILFLGCALVVFNVVAITV
uniref:Amino acid transporter transmembrane domain-containing protein n=2 Tax=Palpitomonas bilix TaxID=652834 RepID=A0A7S3GH40_9EUKA|mmetsp:Transcript_49330/g.127198  ORF Transcript_49330/g.127198 Transcript_49330/m.127198 type:complete len:706 (+) Transcript_49330:274-2391(+)|eukprot:CAMPEP_0113891480 /NCGR_PEP_ID=MMETSP0780_2-20120614/14786_1 /TAXON_ID=652834 /ORGANISM="Palpitomonas bilix" /LENGTH=705 /DNA_ID=CAMNT_0000881115 /DNA_START=139 /DNA_END=2256 /DNA_ORIENTATION=- /assembly_acc=CAM_ASM_000599